MVKCMASMWVFGADDAPSGPWRAQCTRHDGHDGPHVDATADWTWRQPWARPCIRHVPALG